jgi:nitrogen-specific signal transduction histidine kinase
MTTPAPVCLLLTLAPNLADRLARAAGGLANILAVADRSELTRAEQRIGPTVLVLDLRHPETEAVLAAALPESRGCMIAIGLPDSEAFLACRDADIFAAEPLDAPAAQLRRTLRHAILLRQAREDLSLERQPRAGRPPDPYPAAAEPALNLAPLHELWRASRHFRDHQKLLEQLVEGIAVVGRFARVGVVVRLDEDSSYRLRAGIRCPDGADAHAFDPADPLVRWLDRHAHLVCRANLDHVADLRDQQMLRRALDSAGAEVIVPLIGKRGLLGWIAVGHRVTGIPFASHDFSDLAVIGEQVATLLENALLVEELAVQKTLAENLLEALPVGILAVAGDGTVRWFNREAEHLLGVTAAETINRPVEQSGSRIADLALRTIRNGADAAPAIWNDPASRRTLRAVAQRIGANDACWGAMLLLTDITHERLLREKQEEMERHAFWNDLAAAMSHEVRNPLVAISTFAQLLPDRYTDPEFRQQFFSIVTGEVGRLNAIITQINTFAHPPQPVFRKTAPGEIATRACALATQRAAPGTFEGVREVEAGLPLIDADADALIDGLAHVLVNAHEAVGGRASRRIVLQVRCNGTDPTRTLIFAVSDNGPGVAAEVRDKLFSPFCTTKPRGLGLGLPLARRAVVDHGGWVDVDTNENGTTVTITLPLEGRISHAETADR